MAFKDGDFIEVEYSVWNAAGNTMLETTNEKLAKEHGIYSKDVRYGPVLIILGAHSVVKGLDSALREIEQGKEKKITLKPAEAFGERNPDLVRVMPLSEFRKRDVDPYPGMRVDLDNVGATVKSVNSGRVVLDANHPYAGMDVTYEVRVVKRLTGGEEKVSALGRTYGSEPGRVKIDGKRIEVEYGDSVKKNADYFIGKANLIAAVFSNLKDAEEVRVVEEYKRPKEAQEDGHEHEHAGEQAASAIKA